MPQRDAPAPARAQILRPLGLQPVRLRAVRSISAGFLGEWGDPTEFYGAPRGCLCMYVSVIEHVSVLELMFVGVCLWVCGRARAGL